MKNLSYLLVALSVITACKQQQKGEQKSAAPTEKETTYNDDQYRRFTYFFQREDKRIKDFFQSGRWQQVREKINSKEIFDLKVYNMDSDYFLVIDADPILNSHSLFNVLSEEPVFIALVEVLESKGHEFLAHDKALERIYKLEQKVAYSPPEGQLKTKIGTYKRFVWTLLLEEDPALMAEYRKVHGIGMAWPEITDNMKTIGVKDMEIYLYGSQAILIMDTKPGFDLDEVGPKWQQLPREQEWQEFVGKFQRTDPESSIQEKWKTMNLY